MVAEVIGAYGTDDQSPNQTPAPTVEVFTTTVSNVLEWSVAETLAKYVTMSSIGVKKRYSKGGGGRPPVAVTNL